MKTYPTLRLAILGTAKSLLNTGQLQEMDNWQSTQVKGTEKSKFHEALNICFSAPMGNPDTWEHQIKPNLPWAKDHFLERVGGLPINPGNQYKNWPFYKGKSENDSHRKEEGRFSHTYMERIWPKHAGILSDDSLFEKGENLTLYKIAPHVGIRYEYGDLNDIVNHLLSDKHSRQAFLPIWFPEDTGAAHKQRVPCTLGYHFIIRKDYLHITYFIRSCDFFRHFQDDIYLAVRLTDWLRDNLVKLGGEEFKDLKLGMYNMHIVNLHIFHAEVTLLEKWITRNA